MKEWNAVVRTRVGRAREWDVLVGEGEDAVGGGGDF